MWTVDHQTIIRLISGQFKEQKRGRGGGSLHTLVLKTLSVRISIGRGERNKGIIVWSKHIGYLGCEFKLNGYFVYSGADRLVQFTKLASYCMDEMDSNFYA